MRLTRNQVWFIATVGSNPTLSASKFKPRGVFRGAFFVGKVGTKWDFGYILVPFLPERENGTPHTGERRLVFLLKRVLRLASYTVYSNDICLSYPWTHHIKRAETIKDRIRT